MNADTAKKLARIQQMQAEYSAQIEARRTAHSKSEHKRLTALGVEVGWRQRYGFGSINEKEKPMHAAKIYKSKRLQRIRKILSDHKPHSSMELSRRAKSVAIATDVSEIRHNNFDIQCKRNGNVWYYRMIT